MSFSKQDARYEAKPLDLSEYSAVDMMADLGLHRRVSLPLQGRATIIPPPPPDIHKRGPMLARIVERDAEIQTAWGSVYDPTLVEGREDGLGAGQMHRTGQNFIPDDVRQRSPTRLRRARSADGSGIGGRFELGRRPGKAPHPRPFPEPSQALRTVRERGRVRSPDELDPEGDILAELRVESQLRMAKYKTARPAARIVGHHIASNPPVAPRAPSRSVSMLSFHSSRIVPHNPLVSQWGAGNKLATAKAGYNYANDLDAKKAGKAPTGPALQDRALSKVNDAAPKAPPSFAPRTPHSLVPKTTPPSIFVTFPPKPSPTKTAPLPVPDPTVSSRPLCQIPFPDTTQFFPRIVDNTWTGDRPFGAEAGKKLADVTNNVDNTPKADNDTAGPIKPVARIPSAPSPIPEQERLDLEGPSIDLPTIDDQDEALSYALQPREPLDGMFVVNNTEDSDISSEFDQPLGSDSSIFSTARPTHGEEPLYLSEGSGHTEEDSMTKLLIDLRTISDAVHELKAKCLDCEGFEATLTTRLGEIRRLQKDMLSEIDAEEKAIAKIKDSISTLIAKRVAVAEALRDKEIEKNASETEEVDEAKATMEAEFRAMINEHEALMKEHETSEAGDVTMSDIKEEDEPIGEESNEEESSTETMSDIKEDESTEEESTEKSSSTETMSDIKEEEPAEEPADEESSIETIPDTEDAEPDEEPSTETIPDIEGKEAAEESPSETTPDITDEKPVEEVSSAENERIEKEWIEEARPKNDCIQEEFADGLERARVEKARLENGSTQEQIRKLEMARIGSERSKSDVVEAEKVRPQEALSTVEAGGREKDENDSPAAELLEQEQEDRPLQEAIDKTEFDLKPDDAEKDFRRERTEDERATAPLPEKGRTIQRIVTEADDRQRTEKVRLEKARIGRYDAQSKKDQLEKSRIEKAHLEEMRLEREYHENARAEADNHRTRAERTRREEERLVKEHLAKVRHQEERFKAERVERQRIEEEGLQAERDEKARLEAASLQRDIQRTLVRDQDGAPSSERRGIRIKRNRLAAIEQPAGGPVRQLVFEQRIPLAAPEPKFPYTLELDLQPMYGPHALRVGIEQFGKPRDAVLKSCSEVLSPLHYSELSEMPDFQKFLDECDNRHSHRMARAYGSSGRG